MEKKQKILIVHNFYKIPGGEDSVVANEKKLLEENGHEVILYTRSNSEIDGFSKLKKLMLPFTSVFSFKTYREIKRIIKKEKIDIVHVHNTLSLISPSVYYAARKRKVPVVQTIHNFRMVCPAATLYRDGHICEDCINKGLKNAIKHKCYRNSKLQTVASVLILKIHRLLGIYKKINYICLTEFNKSILLKQKQIKEKQVFVKPNFSFADKEVNIIPFEERLNQFIFAGRLDKLKGIDFLLNAWKGMGEDAPRLIVCGTGPLSDRCQKFVTENNLSNVELMGFVENAKVKQIIAQSKALILPTQWYEGFPMTIVEAFSVGTPVIGPDMGNVGDLIVNGKTGYVFRMDSFEDFKAAINNNLQINDTVFESYTQKYSAETNYRELEMIYEEITA